MPINVPRYLHLDLSKHVMRNINRFRLRAHTLKVEAAAWIENAMVFAYVTSVLVKMTFFDNFSAARSLFVATGQQPTCS